MMTMSAALGPIHEYQIDQPSLCSPASLSRSTNYKGHKGNPIISVDRSLRSGRLDRALSRGLGSDQLLATPFALSLASE
jgi:hypothetical protein